MRCSPPQLMPAFVLALLVAAPAAGAPRPPYPVFDARVSAPAARPPGPRIAGEAFEVRLTRAVSERLPVAARRAGRSAAIGVPGLDRLAREHGLAFEPEFPGERAPRSPRAPDFGAFFIVHVPPGADVLALLDRFEALPEVASASALPVLRLDVMPNDSLFSVSDWYYQPGTRRDIHAPEAWDVTTGDPSIVVAILDAGVIPYHPDLGGTTAGGFGNLWRHAPEANGTPGVDDDGNGYVDDVSGWDFVNLASAVDVAAGEDWRDEDNDPNDMVGHGTACAGLVAALSNNARGVTGTAWNVKLMPLRIGWAYLGAPPGQGEVRMDFVARAIRYATRAGAHVLNCSFSTANTDGLDAATTAAVDAGVTIVCSSGNDGSPDYLARRPDVISVAATNRDDIVAGFSNVNADVDLCAPGVEIRSTWRRSPPGADSVSMRQPGYSPLLQGTSFSAPMVAGAAALLQSQRVAAGLPLLAPAGIRLRLWETADDISALNPTVTGRIGGGRLNVAAALAATGGSTATRMGATVVGAPVVIQAASLRDRVAFVTSNAKLVVLDLVTADTLVIASLPDTPVSGVAAVTLDFGRTVALFAGTERGLMLGYDLDGDPLPGWPTPELGQPLRGGPAIGDLDSDGRPEIVCGGDDASIHAWRLDGTGAPGFPRALGFDPIRAPVALAPLDTVAGYDVIAANEAGLVAVHRGTGPRMPGWPKSFPSSPRAPVVAGANIYIVEGDRLHRLTAAGVEEPGSPATLGGPALADPAIRPVAGGPGVDIVVPVGPPFRLEVRSGEAALISAPGFPALLAAGTIGTPIVGQVASDGEPEIVVLDGSGLKAFDYATVLPIGDLPKPGMAGLAPTLWDVGRDGIPDIVAGSGVDSAFYRYGAERFPSGSFPRPWPTPRRNVARTGERDGNADAFVDDVRPARVTDLEIVAATDTSVTLRWRATGSDSLTGVANSWLVHATESSMNEVAFDAAPYRRIVPVTGPFGTFQSVVFSGIPRDRRLEFALKALDHAGNLSALSNVAVADGLSAPMSLAILAHPSQLPVTFAWQSTRGSGDNVLRIFDLSGRKRATIPLGAGPGGSFAWYGTDDDGRRVEAGLYFVRFTSGGETIEKRLVVLP